MTFLQLLTKLQRRLEDEDDGTWSADHKKDALNQSNAELLVDLYETTEFQQKSTTITTTSGTKLYDLPADFMYVRRVYRDDFLDLTILAESPVAFTLDAGEPVSCWIEDAYKIISGVTSYAQVGFWPIPSAAWVYAFPYFPIPDVLTADADVSPVPVTFHDVIIIDAAIKCYNDRGLKGLAGGFKEERDERWYKLEAYMAKRNRYQTVGMHNVF